MRIRILALGSRGDVVPYTAIGRELAARGHEVGVVCARRYRDLVTAAGLPCIATSVDPASLLDINRLPSRNRLIEVIEQSLREVTRACAGADVIVCSNLGVAGHSLAERDGIVSVQAMLHPHVPAPPRWPDQLVHRLINRGRQRLYRKPVNAWRREMLGLPELPPGPLVPQGTPTLYGYSEWLVPPPRQREERHEVTGYWLTPEPEGWQPPEDLADFIAAGPAPVYVGFGSMAPLVADRAGWHAAIRDGVRRAGLRAVVAGDPGQPPSDGTVHVATDVPHTWLLPRVAAAVHHGGAGTTAAALAAGVPSVVVPFAVDQPLWAERLEAHGAGVRLAGPSGFTAGTLAAALTRVTGEPRRTHRARALGARIRAENGVARACDLIETWAAVPDRSCV